MFNRSCHRALKREGMFLRVGSVSTEHPRGEGVLVRICFVGVCGTDLQILNGSRPDITDILGHEGVGIVVQTGGASAFRVGETVIFNPTAQMSSGKILGHNVPGLFQEYFYVDAAAVDRGLIVSANDYQPSRLAALAEPLAAVIYGHELVMRRVTELQTVAVFGAGPLGVLSSLYLGGLGIEILLVHPRMARLNTAISLGVIKPRSAIASGGELARRMVERNGGREFDAALICTTRKGAPEALSVAAQVVKSGGCIDMMANYPEEGAALDGISAEALRSVRAANACGMPAGGEYLTLRLADRCIAITGHRGTAAHQLRRAMQLLASNESPYERIITHTLSIQDAAEAVSRLACSIERTLFGCDCIKAVIDLAS